MRIATNRGNRTAKGRRRVRQNQVAKGANARAKNPNIKHNADKKGKVGCRCGSASKIINYF